MFWWWLQTAVIDRLARTASILNALPIATPPSNTTARTLHPDLSTQTHARSTTVAVLIINYPSIIDLEIVYLLVNLRQHI